MSLIQDFFTYLENLFRAINLALTLDPRLFEAVLDNPSANSIVLGIVFLAGASTLLGHSVVLFVNRVRRGRFFLSLSLNGVMYIISYLVWGAVIALIGTILFNDPPAPGAIIRMVGLSTAPLIFGFFILIPWMGPFVGRVLNIWGFLILVNVIEFGFQVSLLYALICVGLGWLLMMLLNNFVGRPVIALRNRMWQKVAGSSLDASTEDLLLQFSQGKDATTLLRGGNQ
jgi:hypothetical protein